jgi:hypothetical protein
MLCKTSPSRFRTVLEHHKTQEELDAETFPGFTSPVGTELTDKEEIKKIEKKSALLLPAQYSEPVTPERSPPKKQVWRKKDQSTPSKDQSLPASSTNQSIATTSMTWE